MAKLYLTRKMGVSILFIFFSMHAFSQARISGKVISSDDDNGLPGVSILEKGNIERHGVRQQGGLFDRRKRWGDTGVFIYRIYNTGSSN